MLQELAHFSASVMSDVKSGLQNGTRINKTNDIKLSIHLFINMNLIQFFKITNVELTICIFVRVCIDLFTRFKFVCGSSNSKSRIEIGQYQLN